jgi:hypothetical protein
MAHRILLLVRSFGTATAGYTVGQYRCLFREVLERVSGIWVASCEPQTRVETIDRMQRRCPLCPLSPSARKRLQTRAVVRACGACAFLLQLSRWQWQHTLHLLSSGVPCALSLCSE